MIDFEPIGLLALGLMMSLNSSGVGVEKAIFAGGCFWCMVKPFHKYEGVINVVSGYIGGLKETANYKDVCSGTTGHVEAVEVEFDPVTIRYEDLLEIFWRAIDPTDSGGQFNDRGSQYRPAIFFLSEEQRRKAESSRDLLGKSGRFKKDVLVSIEPAKDFYAAEDYHQDYYKKNSIHYEAYQVSSGRAGFIDNVWGSSKNYDLKKDAQVEIAQEDLSPQAWHVMKECGTEPPFQNEFWNHKESGIYVDRISGKALFSSIQKYDSGSGWPSFVDFLEGADLEMSDDESHGMKRVEVRSKTSDSHLGHVFSDGPAPTGLRYCINSAALRFVPLSKLKEEGYERYLSLFEK